jgi:hypothetical protein
MPVPGKPAIAVGLTGYLRRQPFLPLECFLVEKIQGFAKCQADVTGKMQIAKKAGTRETSDGWKRVLNCLNVFVRYCPISHRAAAGKGLANGGRVFLG